MNQNFDNGWMVGEGNTPDMDLSDMEGHAGDLLLDSGLTAHQFDVRGLDILRHSYI